MTPSAASGTTVLRLRPDRTQRLEALLLGAGPHLEPVLDVGTATNGDLLLVLPEPAMPLPQLLAAPGSLTAGEAVTVLVPLAQALHRLHQAGIAHGGIRAAAVVLDADGSPAWSAPVAPTLLRKVGPTPFASCVAEDVAAFRSLCRSLLEPVGIAVPSEGRPDVLAGALFGLARPEPVRLVRAADPVPVGPPARLLPAAAVAQPPLRSPRTEILGVALGQLRAVRGRVWAALGGVAVLIAAALVLLPSGERAPAAPATRSMPAPARGGTPSAAPSASAVAGSRLPASQAVPALLRERDRCLAAGSDDCLRRVDAAGSPALDADLRAVQAGTEAVRVDRTRVRVTSVSGGTALATAGGATVLAIRDRNEWRLRDVVAEPPAGG